MKMLVTGAAEFIGYHLCEQLLARGDTVVGVDNLNPYYDVNLKNARLQRLQRHPGFEFRRLDLADRAAVSDLAARAAENPAPGQAGVRYSLENPQAYIDANLLGFANVLEICRQIQAAHLVYASSSSANTGIPFSVHQNVDHPLSPMPPPKSQRADGACL